MAIKILILFFLFIIETKIVASDFTSHLDTEDAFGLKLEKSQYKIINDFFIKECKTSIKTLEKSRLNPLSQLAYNNHESMVNHLLELGFDSNYVDRWNQTSIYIASEFGRDNILRSLLKYGGDLNKNLNSGNHSLCVAVFNGHYTAVSILLQNGINYKEKDIFGRTVFDYLDRAIHINEQESNNKNKEYLNQNLQNIKKFLYIRERFNSYDQFIHFIRFIKKIK